jgi:organic radical activating enzyme
MTTIGNSLNQKTIENIKRERIPVIIFGAGIVGEVLFQACNNVGIKVECFCDNNINKTKSPMCNVEVIHPKNLKTRYKDASFLVSAADIKDVVDQLHDLGFLKWYASSLLLRNYDVFQYQFSAPTDFVEFAVSTCLLCHDSYLNPDKLFLRSVDIIITERCSLRCRDCSNLMQYYKKPKDCNTEEVMQSIDAFCALVDELNEFRVIGGEPLMNKEFHLTIKRLTDEPKVKKIVIYTNGTIVPKEYQIGYLKNNKVLFIITDYGILSKKLNTLTQILSQNNIAFYAQKARGWTDCAKITRHYRNAEQQKELFKNCCAKNTATLSKGRLYRCPFAANAARLLAVPDRKNDYINILQKSQKAVDIDEMKKKIRTFLLEKDFLETCDYCNGRSFEAPEIISAVQINKPLEYEKYLL